MSKRWAAHTDHVVGGRMRVIMFQPQFVPLIMDGTKIHTIRKRARCQKGDMLGLRHWQGKPYRSKQVQFMKTPCVDVIPIRICDAWIEWPDRETRWPDVDFPQDGDRDIVAIEDGFPNWLSMRDWFRFTHELPFDGELIAWR